MTDESQTKKDLLNDDWLTSFRCCSRDTKIMAGIIRVFRKQTAENFHEEGRVYGTREKDTGQLLVKNFRNSIRYISKFRINP